MTDREKLRIAVNAMLLALQQEEPTETYTVIESALVEIGLPAHGNREVLRQAIEQMLGEVEY